MPRKRSLSKGLPSGLLRKRPGGPLWAQRYSFEQRMVRWESTGKVKPAEAMRVRDEWQRTIDRVKVGQPTAEGVTPSQAVAEYIGGKRTAARKRSPEHVDQTEALLVEFLGDAKLRCLTEITVESVSKALDERKKNRKPRTRKGSIADRQAEAAHLRAVERAKRDGSPIPERPEPAPPKPLSAGSIRHRIVALKGFTRWLANRGILARDPLAGMELPVPEPVYLRGVLTPEEQCRLIDGVAGLGVRKGMTGVERQAIYAAAMSTGMRLSELISTKAMHWHVASELEDEHFVELQHTKNKLQSRAANAQAVRQPILALRTHVLRSYFAGRDPEGPAFSPRLSKNNAAKLIRADLEALGMATSDEFGVRDFHCLRGSYKTHLDVLGIDMVESIQMTRHGDTKTALKHYTKHRVASIGAKANKALKARDIGATFPSPSSGTQPHPSWFSVGTVAGDLTASNLSVGTWLEGVLHPTEPRESESHQRDLNPQPPDYKSNDGGVTQDSESGDGRNLQTDRETSRDIREIFNWAPSGTAPTCAQNGRPIDLSAVWASVEAVHSRASTLVEELGEAASEGENHGDA